MNRRIQGHVCFTGGNPLIYPHFLDLYKAAVQQGFSTSILGNPAPRKQIEDLAAVQKPTYFQVSLEGLQEHNDAIRGEGNYIRVLEFMGILRDCGVSPAVMLTLTRDNIDQVLPLAEKLRGHADRFTFNRLSLVGEGAHLHLPSMIKFKTFLKDYVDASRKNPILGIKDNLINILRQGKGQKPFGGCTGFGCGAAFSFLALLPDGQVHACRKFPSPLGNVFKQSLSELYDSNEAQKYRQGTEACKECSLRPVCGGCLSISHSFGLDVFKERDPFCFVDR
jgi:selenobiotic family peptide radical SAM maturase